MRDKSNIPRIARLHPSIREEVALLIDKAEMQLSSNIAIRISDDGGYRSFDEQAKIYAQGRTSAGKIVTNAWPGSSFHNYGLAFDFCLVIDNNGDGKYDESSWDIRKDNDHDGVADWLEVVNIFEAAGYVWGGKWKSIKDYPHLEKTFGYTYQQLLDRHTKKDFIVGTEYVNLKRK